MRKRYKILIVTLIAAASLGILIWLLIAFLGPSKTSAEFSYTPDALITIVPQDPIPEGKFNLLFSADLPKQATEPWPGQIINIPEKDRAQ